MVITARSNPLHSVDVLLIAKPELNWTEPIKLRPDTILIYLSPKAAPLRA